MQSFPLHGGGRLGGDVVADAIDVLDLAHDAAGDLIQQLIGQAGPRGGHEVLRLHSPQGQRVVVGAFVAHDTHTAQIGEHGEELAVWVRSRPASFISSRKMASASRRMDSFSSVISPMTRMARPGPGKG